MDPLPTLQRLHEAEQLLHELAARDDRFITKTLDRSGAMQTDLFALRQGSRILLERALGDLAIRVVAGHLQLHAGDVWDQLPYLIRYTEGACSFFSLYDHSIDLPVGTLVILGAEVPHDVEALDDSAFVLELRA